MTRRKLKRIINWINRIEWTLVLVLFLIVISRMVGTAYAEPGPITRVIDNTPIVESIPMTTTAGSFIEDNHEVIIITSETETETETETSEETEPVKTYLGSFKATAYCSCSKCCGKWSGGPTKSGTMPEEGRTIAVDPNVIPLGSHVIINDHEYIAEDTGSMIKGNRIDIYFQSHSAALQWGVRYVDIYTTK